MQKTLAKMAFVAVGFAFAAVVQQTAFASSRATDRADVGDTKDGGATSLMDKGDAGRAEPMATKDGGAGELSLAKGDGGFAESLAAKGDAGSR